MCAFLSFQEQIEYGNEPQTCQSTCKLAFRERRDVHNYLFHEPKTRALVCGCGFGELHVPRMRQHLLKQHGVDISDADEIVDRYFM